MNHKSTKYSVALMNNTKWREFFMFYHQWANILVLQ